jgi:pimeloyl-ACP methyl ester carboxylesterase
MIDRRTLLAAAGALSLGTGRQARATETGFTAARTTLTHDDGRITLCHVLIPQGQGPWPVVVFSHGANSSGRLYDRLLGAWAARGVLVLAPDHLDSGGPADPAHVPAEGLWASRVADLRLPLDQRAPFEALAAAQGARIDWRRVASAGHSFGAVVAQALAGARLTDPKTGAAFDGRDARVGAVVTFSPPGPRAGLVPADAWEGVTIPALLETGDADRLPGFVDDWRTHKAGFESRPNRERWLLVGSGVDHYFGGLICRLKDDDAARAQALALDAATTISGDFLCAHLRGDRRAAKRLARAARTDAYAPALTLTRL